MTLQAALAVDPQYDTHVREGNNGAIVDILNVPDDRLPDRWTDVSVADFLNAIALESFTREQEERIRTYTEGERHLVFLSLDNIRTWVMDNVSLPGTVTELTRISRVDGKPADAFTDGRDITLNDVRVAVRQISKSYIVSRQVR